MSRVVVGHALRYGYLLDHWLMLKDSEVESAETIAKRIERAVGILGADRIRWTHPDCGFWMLSRSVADRKMAALVAGRDLFEGT